MLFFTVSLVAGFIAGWILLRLTRTRGTPAEAGQPSLSASGWVALAMGLASAAVFVLAVYPVFLGSDSFTPSPVAMSVSIGLPAAALVHGVGSLARGQRQWTNWLGLALGLLPALFWIAFAVGEIFGPPH